MRQFLGFLMLMATTVVAISFEINFFYAFLIVLLPFGLIGVAQGRRESERRKADKALIEMNERQKRGY
ncbi:hypothetical protein [Cognatishimia sp.]|uniref:hypothetical protein n=1 Tax=Cognatishimia sp. TaxID=2211648 RepID=UPI003518533F|nr:hypothetical protein [Cognatishimia sp.]